MKESLCPHLQLVVVLVHVVQGFLEVLHLFVIKVLDVIQLHRLVLLEGGDLSRQFVVVGLEKVWSLNQFYFVGLFLQIKDHC